MDVATTLRRARERAGLSQAALARRAGTSQATISAYEGGHKTPSVATPGPLLAGRRSRLTSGARRPAAQAKSPAEISRRGRTLIAVLELAEALRTRREPKL